MPLATFFGLGGSVCPLPPQACSEGRRGTAFRRKRARGSEPAPACRSCTGKEETFSPARGGGREDAGKGGGGASPLGLGSPQPDPSCGPGAPDNARDAPGRGPAARLEGSGCSLPGGMLAPSPIAPGAPTRGRFGGRWSELDFASSGLFFASFGKLSSGPPLG
nr:mucin-1-like [Chrysemys picta bellii]